MRISSTAKTPTEYLNALAEPRKKEVKALHAFIQSCLPATEKPHMMSGMIGYGTYHYKYASGREGDWSVIALASQKNYISLYVCAMDEKGYLAERYASRFPKASIGKSCIRFKKLEDIDLEVLKELLQTAVNMMKK